jgi:hypothetical protein
LLNLLKLKRITRAVASFPLLCPFLCSASWAFPSHHYSGQRITYRTQLGNDLDGDHIPETATIRLCGYIYQVSIHFTTGRPGLRLTTYLTEGLAGFSLQATDVNNDNKADLVIVSATSIRPIAVWVNQGKSTFQRVSTWPSGGAATHNGPSFRRRGLEEPEPLGNALFDPLPHATLAVQYFGPEAAPAALIFLRPDQLPFDSVLWHVPPRGPPASSRV